MSLSGILPRVLIGVALLCPLGFVHAAAPEPSGGSDGGSVAAQFLVATPEIGDPRFDRTVILMIHHDKDGAFGVTINRPAGTRPIAEILDWIGAPHEGITGEVPIFAGGPVQEQIGFILHSTDYHRPETVAVGPGVAITSSVAILRDMGHGKGPKKTLVAFGYAGWMPGQLEAEMDHNAWITVPLDPVLIFDTDPEKMWSIAWSRRSINL